MRKDAVAVQHLQDGPPERLRSPDVRRLPQSCKEPGSQFDRRVAADRPIADQERACSGMEESACQTREAVGGRAAIGGCGIARGQNPEVGIPASPSERSPSSSSRLVGSGLNRSTPCEPARAPTMMNRGEYRSFMTADHPASLDRSHPALSSRLALGVSGSAREPAPCILVNFATLAARARIRPPGSLVDTAPCNRRGSSYLTH